MMLNNYVKLYIVRVSFSVGSSLILFAEFNVNVLCRILKLTPGSCSSGVDKELTPIGFLLTYNLRNKNFSDKTRLN